MRPDFIRNFIHRVVAIMLLLAFWGPLNPALAQQEATEAPPSEIQKTIDILESEERRQELITLLKLLAVLEEQKAATGTAGGETISGVVPEEETAGPTDLKGYIRGLTGGAWRDLSSTGAGLRQSWRDVKDVFGALAQPWAVEIWRPYLLKAFVWGLACLIVTWLIIRKYGRPPEACFSHDFGDRLKALVKYVLIVAGPNLVLILSLLALPELSTTAPGVTADLATGFAFIHALIQHLFVNLSVLYISLRVAQALFTPSGEGHCLINLHPVLSRHFLHSWRVFAVYTALFAFVKDTCLEQFANGSLYSVVLVFLTLPVPIYLTFRLVKLRRLVHLISEAEASAGAMEDSADALANSEEEEDEALDRHPPPARIDYLADIFIKKHWAPLAMGSVWLLSFISLLNPADAANRFGARLIGSLILIGLAALGVRLIRLLVLRLVEEETEHGRRLVLHLDGLTNVLVWAVVAFLMLSLWGFPLISVLENEITRDILSRAFTITVVIIVVGVFIRFSRLATEWLLAVPNLGQNRNWRTMAPLVLTAARSLAVFIGVVVVLERLGVNVGPILAGAGILGLGVGMGAQSLVKDVINGISILLMDTLAVGDWVVVGGKSGTVEALGLRTIRLRDSSGNLTVVPNSSVDTIVNMTKDYSQDLVEFVAPYDADPDAMLQMSREVARELSLDPAWRPYCITPATVVGVIGFDANGTTIRIKINTSAGNQWAVGRELRLRLKRRMLKDGLKSPWFGQNVFLFQGDPEYDKPDSPQTADDRHDDGQTSPPVEGPSK